MANYIASDTDLTAVANAIRTKGGTSASLAFPADFVSAIGAIETGGGGGLKYETGIFTLDTDLTLTNDAVYAIPHGLGEKPSVVIVFAKDYPEADTDPFRGYIWLDKPMGESRMYLTTNASYDSDYPISVQYYMRQFTSGNMQSRLNVPAGNYANCLITAASLPTATHIYLFQHNTTTTFNAGDYRYFVCEKWW